MQSTSVYAQSRCTLTYSHRALSYSSFLHGSRMGEVQCRDIRNVENSQCIPSPNADLHCCCCNIVLPSNSCRLPTANLVIKFKAAKRRMLDACAVDLMDVERRLMIYHAARSSLWPNHHLGAPSSTARVGAYNPTRFFRAYSESLLVLCLGFEA